MDRTSVGDRAYATPAAGADTEAIEFVRFCHRRRQVGWPELYDEMCAVAGRGLYRGYGPEELASIGIGLGLFQMPALASLVARVVAEDQERRRRAAAAVRASLVEDRAGSVPVIAAAEETVNYAAAAQRRTDPEPAEHGVPDLGAIRIAVPAGA